MHTYVCDISAEIELPLCETVAPMKDVYTAKLAPLTSFQLNAAANYTISFARKIGHSFSFCVYWLEGNNVNNSRVPN